MKQVAGKDNSGLDIEKEGHVLGGVSIVDEIRVDIRPKV